MSAIVPEEGIVPQPKNSKLTNSTMATSTHSEEWEETYFKLLLLYVDKVSFVQCFLVPTFPGSPDLPTFKGVVQFVLGMMLVWWSYLVSQWSAVTAMADPGFHDDTWTKDERSDREWDQFGKMSLIFTVLVCLTTPIVMIVFVMAWTKEIGSPGRIGCLMEAAKLKPPRRDHATPYGFTWYRDAIKYCLYGMVIASTLCAAANGVGILTASQIGLIILLLSEPLQNINERTWGSTAISDAEVVITAAMQSQCIFAEGASNSIAVNLKALADLKWDSSKMKLKEQVRKAAQAKDKYSFDVFDVGTGYHTTCTRTKATQNKPEHGSVAKAVMQELFNQRNQFMEMME